VQALAGLPDALGQPGLDVHVDVLERLEKAKSPASISRRSRPGPADRGLVLGRDDPHMASIAAWARLPRMSWRHILRSKPMEALISRMMAPGPSA
jgi:hypothetical protein